MSASGSATAPTTACSCAARDADNPDQRIAEDIEQVRRHAPIRFSIQPAQPGRDARLLLVILWSISARLHASRARTSSCRACCSGSRSSMRSFGTWRDPPHRPAADPRSTSSSSATRPISASRWRGCANTPSRSRCSTASEPTEQRLRSAASARIVDNFMAIVNRRKQAHASSRRATARSTSSCPTSSRRRSTSSARSARHAARRPPAPSARRTALSFFIDATRRSPTTRRCSTA